MTTNGNDNTSVDGSAQNLMNADIGHPAAVNASPHDSGDPPNESSTIGSSISLNNLDDGDLGESGEDEEDFEDPGGSGAGVAIPDAIPPEPNFLENFSSRFNSILADENPNFTEFCSLTDDFINCIKKQLRFKEREGDGAVRPPKKYDVNNPTEMQKLYRHNRKKALRLIYGEESEFCDLDPEEVANHYNSEAYDKPPSTEFMIEGNPAPKKMNTSPFTRVEVSRN